MKKVLAIILAFVYLTSSMGATVHLHYCMGKLASWSLIDHESKNCAECGMVAPIELVRYTKANMIAKTFFTVVT